MTIPRPAAPPATTPPAALAGNHRPAASWLALGAVAGPVLFTLTWLWLGLVSPGYALFDHRFTDYSPISQPISGLGMGVTAPYMNAAFVLTGLMLMVGVTGVFLTIGPAGRPAARRASMVLLATSGAGQVVAGVFDLEAVMPHFVGFLLGVGVPVAGFLVAGLYFRTLPRWRRFGTWLLLGSPLTLALLVLFFLTFRPTADGAEQGIAGLVQRVTIIEVQTWYVLMGWLAAKRNRREVLTS